MSQIAANGALTPGLVAPQPTAGLDRLGSPVPIDQPPPADRVEFQSVPPADASQADQLRIEDIRQQIAAGTYLTEHKLNVVVDRLYEVLKAPKLAPESAGPQT